MPAYNEEENIPRIKKELIDVVSPYLKSYEILVIDDGSSDNTVDEVKKLQKRHKQIRLVKHSKNKGLGEALKTGIREAKGKYMIMLDSDFTLHPRQIKSLVEKREKTGADCVSGSPYLRKDGIKDFKIHRKILSKGINTIYRILLGKKISSLTPIFRLYKTSQLREIDLQSPDYISCAEILIKLILRKKKIVEVPVVLTVRELGESKIRFLREIKNHIFLIMKLFRYRFLCILGFKKAKFM